MSTPFAGNPLAPWPDDFPVLDDGDPASAASVAPALEALGDRTAIVGQAIYERWHRIPLASLIMDPTAPRFTWTPTKGWVQTSVASAGELYFDAGMVPLYGTIQRMRVRLDGGGAAHGALPATKPKFTLHYYEDGGSLGELFDFFDDSATLGAYEVPHTVTSAVISPTHDIAANEIYVVQVQGETGANALANAVELYWIEIMILQAT